MSVNHFTAFQRKLYLWLTVKISSHIDRLYINVGVLFLYWKKWWCITSAPYRQTTVRTESTIWEKCTTFTRVNTTVSIFKSNFLLDFRFWETFSHLLDQPVNIQCNIVNYCEIIRFVVPQLFGFRRVQPLDKWWIRINYKVIKNSDGLISWVS